MSNNIYTYDEMKKQIESCGQSILNNAASILGDERYVSNVKVSFEVKRYIDSGPSIRVERDFIPELEIEDEATNIELNNRKQDISDKLKEHSIMKRILVEHGLWETLLKDEEFNKYLREEYEE